MAKYRKRPVVIEAIQWTGSNYKELQDFTLHDFYRKDVDFGTTDATIRTLEGEFRVGQWDWVIKDEKGKRYLCKPDIFEATYKKEV